MARRTCIGGASRGRLGSQRRWGGSQGARGRALHDERGPEWVNPLGDTTDRRRAPAAEVFRSGSTGSCSVATPGPSAGRWEARAGRGCARPTRPPPARRRRSRGCAATAPRPASRARPQVGAVGVCVAAGAHDRVTPLKARGIRQGKWPTSTAGGRETLSPGRRRRGRFPPGESCDDQARSGSWVRSTRCIPGGRRDPRDGGRQRWRALVDRP
jgi:hypothetical protein